MHVVRLSQPFLLFLRSFKHTPGKSSPHPPKPPPRLGEPNIYKYGRDTLALLDSHSRRT